MRTCPPSRSAPVHRPACAPERLAAGRRYVRPSGSSGITRSHDGVVHQQAVQQDRPMAL